MSIDLNKKQIFRTISDMVVFSPNDAKDIFDIIVEHRNSSQFNEIFPIMDFVRHNSPDAPNEDYYLQLRHEIQKIENEEIRIIFSRSLNNLQHAY
ncbi:TPA: hypothetical protein I7148_21895 [Vibrio vulnificus]|nr:hypothetical protein [Vibrio vulnificus]